MNRIAFTACTLAALTLTAPMSLATGSTGGSLHEARRTQAANRALLGDQGPGSETGDDDPIEPAFAPLADVNSDGFIDYMDLLLVLWWQGASIDPINPAYLPADVNHDGIVDFMDMLIVLNILAQDAPQD